MVETRPGFELAIDSAGSPASVALTRQGALVAELTWHTQNNHSAELLPVIEILLGRAGVDRTQIRVIFVDRGPGGYAGLRVGISTAMGLALGLGSELLAVGRLEVDAWPHAAYPGPICPLHQAGRGDVAWAVYEQAGEWRENEAPRLTTLDGLLTAAPPNALFCGEVSGLEERLQSALPEARIAVGAATIRWAAALAELGWRRYAAGARDNPVAVEPLYLREPSITQPKARPALR